MALNLNDQTANGNTLTNNNVSDSASVPFANGNTDSGSFNGTNSSFVASTSTSLVINGDITLEAWVNPTTITASTMEVVSKPNGTNPASYMLRLENGKASFFRGTGAASLGNVLATNAVTANAWHHIAVVMSGTGVTHYLDGATNGTGTINGTPADSGTSPGIGRRITDGSVPFSGLIDEIRVWNVARTSTQIANNYNIQLTGSESGLQAYWPLNTLGGGGNAIKSGLTGFLTSLGVGA